MPSLFRRKSADLVTEQVEAVEPEPAPAPRPKGYTPKKGEATPKRPSANPRGTAPKPANAKEARALSRQKREQDAAERRAGISRGDDRYLTPRDRGPVRRYVRDIVDGRRNAGSIFFFGTLIILAMSFTRNFTIAYVGNLLFLAMLLLIAVDSVFLARRVRRLVRAAYPKSNERMGSLYTYAVMRALAFRRMRVPKPQVRPGDPIAPPAG